MSPFTILIFDPFRSGESERIAAIIQSEADCLCRTIQHREIKGATKDCRPDLIFALFQCCDQASLKTDYRTLFETYKTIPVVGIVDRLLPCSECDILRECSWSFITTPVTRQDILLHLYKFLPHEPITASQPLPDKVRTHLGSQLFIGNSARLLNVKQKICRVAPYDVTVLLSGQTGTGKELSARIIHFLSPRSKKPFVPLNCGAIPRELFENELFGHKKGAYTHADTSQAGLVAAADGGTLFLDEVESLALSAQVKLLRFLEEKKYKPLGASDYIAADVRVIAAAKENLWELVKKQHFRDDLFYRLNVVQICLPPLRDRKEDIPLLAQYFLERYSLLYKKPVKGIRPAGMLKLLHNDWPGNIRELENVIQEAVVTLQTDWINPEDLNLNKLAGSPQNHLESFKSAKQNALKKFERDYLANALTISNGNITHAAQFARQDRRAFSRLLKKYKLDPADFRQ